MMGCRSFYGVAALALSSALLLPACNGWGSLVVTQQDELEFGARAHREILRKYPPCNQCASLRITDSDRRVGEYVESLGLAMAALGNPDRGARDNWIPRWTVTILESDELNAFALPGGYVYVTTGLLQIVATEAELAAILGHEVAHVTQYHGVERMERAIVAQGVVGFVFGDDSLLVDLVGLFVDAYSNFVSGPDDELEADDHGMQYALSGGYNPLDLLKFFEYIQPLQEGQSSALSEILATHPPPAERIANGTAHAAALGVEDPEDPSLRNDDPDLPYYLVADAVMNATGGGTVAGGRLEDLPAWVRARLHACRYDPRRQRMVPRGP